MAIGNCSAKERWQWRGRQAKLCMCSAPKTQHTLNFVPHIVSYTGSGATLNWTHDIIIVKRVVTAAKSSWTGKKQFTKVYKILYFIDNRNIKYISRTERNYKERIKRISVKMRVKDSER